MGGYTRRRQDLQRRSHMRIRASRLVRRTRLRQTIHAVRQRERAPARGQPRAPLAAPRLWQRFLLVPLMIVVQGLRSGLVWLRDVVLPAPPRILTVDPAEFLIIGHRGACAVAVENTLESCERAVEVEGADAVELDLCVTKDRQVVVWHDWDPDTLIALARQAGAELDVLCRPVVPPAGHPLRRPVCDLTLAELRAHYGYAVVRQDQTVPAHIPVLEEVVRWARTTPHLKAVFLDCKVPPARKELITVVAEALRRERRAGAGRGALRVPDALCRGARGAAGSGARDRAVPRRGNPGGVLSRPRAALCRRPGPRGGERVGVHRPAAVHDRRLVDLSQDDPGGPGADARGRGTTPLVPPASYVCWTINRTCEMRHLMRIGVSGILTDFPALPPPPAQPPDPSGRPPQGASRAAARPPRTRGSP